jgi:hypothetical protein
MTEQYRLKPWFHYTDEERSYVIFSAYKKRVLKSEDLKSFVVENRILNWSNWLFPLVAIPVLRRTVWRYYSEFLLLCKPAHYFTTLQFTTVGASWLLWLNFSPFYSKLENKKEDLLDLIERRIGLNVKDLNDALPRYWTS